MTNEVLARNQESRGNRAESLLKNELLIEFWEVTEKALIEKWKQSQVQEERDDIWRNMRMLQNMQNYMNKIVTTGKNAGKELKALTNTKNPTIIDKVKERF